MHDLAPQAARLQHVGLVHTRHLAAALAGDFEGLAGDALDLVLGVLQRVVGALARRSVHAGGRLVVEALAATEVQATGELADDHHVHAVDDLRAQRGGVGQSVEDLHGTQVGVQAQLLTDAQEPLLRTRGGRIGGVPLRAAHGSQQHRVGSTGRIQRRLGQRIVRRIDGRAADERVGVLEGGVVLRTHGVQHLHALGNDLRPDAVAGKQANLVGSRHATRPFRASSASGARGLPR